MKKTWVIFIVLLFVVGCTKAPEEISVEDIEIQEVVDADHSEDESTEEEEAAIVFQVNPDSLRAKAAEKGVYVGSAVSIGNFSFENYTNTLKNEFSMMTTENMMKWDRLNSTKQGQFSYVGPDVIVQYAKDHDMLMRGHAIVWHESLPSWFTATDWTYETLNDCLIEYIDNVMGHFAGDIYAWDVLNEIVNEDGSFRDTIWYRTMGEDYITVALENARRVDPDALLIINDFNIETICPKSDALYELSKELLEAGVPLDGIGFQSHLVSGNIDFESMQKNIERFQALGLVVQFTEIDIRVQSPFTEEKLNVQKEEYKELMTLAIKNDIDTFVTWGISDTQSFVPMMFPDYGSAMIFDELYNPKGGYYGIMEALEEN